jgi:hypothetical protein
MQLGKPCGGVKLDDLDDSRGVGRTWRGWGGFHELYLDSYPGYHELWSTFHDKYIEHGSCAARPSAATCATSARTAASQPRRRGAMRTWRGAPGSP